MKIRRVVIGEKAFEDFLTENDYELVVERYLDNSRVRYRAYVDGLQFKNQNAYVEIFGNGKTAQRAIENLAEILSTGKVEDAGKNKKKVPCLWVSGKYED